MLHCTHCRPRQLNYLSGHVHASADWPPSPRGNCSRLPPYMKLSATCCPWQELSFQHRFHLRHRHTLDYHNSIYVIFTDVYNTTMELWVVIFYQFRDTEWDSCQYFILLPGKASLHFEHTVIVTTIWINRILNETLIVAWSSTVWNSEIHYRVHRPRHWTHSWISPVHSIPSHCASLI